MDNKQLEIYADFLKKALISTGAVTFGDAYNSAQEFISLANKKPIWASVVEQAYNIYAPSKDYSSAMTMIADAAKRISKEHSQKGNQAIAATDCANALPPIAQTIYHALKNNKATIRDSDKRIWRGLTELDCEIHNDNRIRANLWQWEETFTDKGVLERKQVLRSSLASIQDSKSELAVIVRY
jgi:hypothetical protein